MGLPHTDRGNNSPLVTQMIDPQVFVMVELWLCRWSEFPTKHPHLSTALGSHDCLMGASWWWRIWWFYIHPVLLLYIIPNRGQLRSAVQYSNSTRTITHQEVNEFFLNSGYHKMVADVVVMQFQATKTSWPLDPLADLIAAKEPSHRPPISNH